MPTWRNELPLEAKHMGFDLRRTPNTGALHAIITSDDFLVCDTHYFHGRTTPCERPGTDKDGKHYGEACPACAEGIPYRTHVYLSGFDPKRNEHFICEFTSHAAKALDEYRKASGTVRGCIIYATRPKGLKNSMVVIETNTANLAKVKLPEAPDLKKALSVIWRIPQPALEEDSNGNGRKKLKVNGKKIRNMDTQKDNATDPVSIREIIEKRNLISTQ